MHDCPHSANNKQVSSEQIKQSKETAQVVNQTIKAHISIFVPLSPSLALAAILKASQGTFKEVMWLT